MRWLYVFLLVALFAAPAFLNAQEPDNDVVVLVQADGSALVVLTAAKVKKCGQEGGCNIVSASEMAQFIKRIKPQLCKQVDL